MSPFTTVDPGSEGRDSTIPSQGEGNVFSIFIASRTAIGAPVLTVLPSSTRYLNKMPGMGAERVLADVPESGCLDFFSSLI